MLQRVVRFHTCSVNHTGSSGSMKASVVLDLTKYIFNNSNGEVYLNALVNDDESTMRSLLQHCTNHEIGKLPIEIPQPIFLADPSHRIKVISKPFFKMVDKTKDPTKCKTIDALRLKKYLGCYIYKNSHLDLNEFVMKSRASIEYLFNCHEWCDSEWCYAKALTEKLQDVAKSLVSFEY